jgi:hypothetical protein
MRRTSKRIFAAILISLGIFGAAAGTAAASAHASSGPDMVYHG